MNHGDTEQHNGGASGAQGSICTGLRIHAYSSAQPAACSSCSLLQWRASSRAAPPGVKGTQPSHVPFVFAGIGNVRSGLHPVQAALASSHGSQCGFCTPGFVMSMYALLRNVAAEGRGTPSEEDIEECLAGNLW